MGVVDVDHVIVVRRMHGQTAGGVLTTLWLIVDSAGKYLLSARHFTFVEVSMFRLVVSISGRRPAFTFTASNGRPPARPGRVRSGQRRVHSGRLCMGQNNSKLHARGADIRAHTTLLAAAALPASAGGLD
jgi:hypothetical protein